VWQLEMSSIQESHRNAVCCMYNINAYLSMNKIIDFTIFIYVMVNEDFTNEELLSMIFFWFVRFSDGGLILTLRS
jgi:hypothetical protein